MFIFVWIIVGLIAGFIASKIINRSGEGILLDIALGMAGSLIGGWLFHAFGLPGITGLNLYSVLVAAVGAILVLLAYHLLIRRSA